MSLSVLFVENNGIKDQDVKALLESKIPKNAIHYAKPSKITRNQENPDQHDLIITHVDFKKNLKSVKKEKMLDWANLPDLSLQLDVFVQLYRYQKKYPLNLKNWRLIEVLHDGKDAVIYKAINKQGKFSAIKRFKFKSFKLSRSAIERFLQRVDKQCGIRSNGLVHFYEGGICNHAFYLVMEYLGYGTLRQNLNSCEKSLPLNHALEWFREIAEALGIVHNAGLIHRDLKIDNILMREDGTLALMDYGVSKSILLDAGLLDEHEIHCSPHYVSPEIIAGEPCSMSSDIYSLGVIFYELLMGEKPYQGSNAQELMMKHVTEPVPQLSADLKGYQAYLEKMMAKNPANRFSSVKEIMSLKFAVKA